jgi:hypothetical protein
MNEKELDMTLPVPTYIRAANIQDTSIRYKWDDWDVEQAEEPVDQEFLGRLKGLSQSAMGAFTIGTAEWIAYRFAPFIDDPLPLQFLEASWANLIDFFYCGAVWETYVDDNSWSGPVRGPLGIAMLRVDYTLQEIVGDRHPEIIAVWINNLVQYVLTDPEPYLMWRERVMERLEALYPSDPQDKLGEVVPRQALDPDFDFRLGETESLINRFLASLDYRANPFLNSPEKMLEQGFEGTPYVFDIEKDRQSRRGHSTSL